MPTGDMADDDDDNSDYDGYDDDFVCKKMCKYGRNVKRRGPWVERCQTVGTLTGKWLVLL